MSSWIIEKNLLIFFIAKKGKVSFYSQVLSCRFAIMKIDFEMREIKSELFEPVIIRKGKDVDAK